MNTPTAMAMVLSPVASKQAVRILTLFKCGYWLLVLTALLIQPSMNLASFRSVNQRWPRAGEPTFASHFATWDTAHYLNLSEVGYSRGEPSCAFYPFWPLLVRWLSFLTGGSHLLAGLLLANACSLAAWILFHRLVARRWGNTAAHWSLAFLILFPGSLFFQFHYTEGLFLLLTMALWWGLETQRQAWGFLAAFLLPLTRAVGVFSILPIAARVLGPSAPWFKSWFEQIKLGIGKPSYGTPGDYRVPPNPGELSTPACCLFPWRAVSSRAWLLTAPLAGWGVYLALMWYWTGNPFEGFAAQKHWRAHAVGNLWDAPKFVAALFTPTEWHTFRGSVLDRCVFLLLINCLPIIWSLDKGLLIWTYILGILPAMSGTFTSFTRFASCAFPMFIALGVFLAPSERRWLRYGLLLVFAVLHVILSWRFVNFRWAG